STASTVELVGAGHVTVTFELPPALRAEGGAPALPLRFGASDGRVTFPGSGRALVFDPSHPVSFTIPPGSGGATVFLGGSAEPGTRQPPGAYTGGITVTVVVANPAT
ncbi:MAG TPA: hypothetical protein VM890_08015, partial [Longimicrobium sp.]|nr:hypothetical protein [Longimicrobium sp.]